MSTAVICSSCGWTPSGSVRWDGRKCPECGRVLSPRTVGGGAVPPAAPATIASGAVRTLQALEKQPVGLFKALGVIVLLLALIGMGYAAWALGQASRELGSEFAGLLLAPTIIIGVVSILAGIAWISVGSMGATVNQLVRVLLEFAKRSDGYVRRIEALEQTQTRSREDQGRA